MTEHENHTSTSRRRFLKGVAGAVGVTALSGVPFETARAQTELTMLTWNGFAAPELISGFERKHGVKVRAKYYVGGAEMLSLISQSPRGTYDVILADSEYVKLLQKAGYIQALDPTDYPFQDFFPEFRHFPLHWHNESLYATALRYGFLGVSYNTDRITAEQASTYRVFWEPSLKNKMAHFDWHLPNLGQISLLNGNYPPFDIDQKAWQQVQETALSLRSQVAGFYGYGSTLSALKNGEVYAMLGIGDWITGLLARDGGPFDTVVPKEGGLQWTESLCIGTGSRNSEIAAEFLRYMMSPEGQVKAVTLSYPCVSPSRAAWERLAESHPEVAARQRMLLDQHNAMDVIRSGRIYQRNLPVQQSLQDWNSFWQRYKNV